MNGADLVILGILLVSIVVSLFRGFIKEVFSILVWVAAIFAAFQVAGPLAVALEPIIDRLRRGSSLPLPPCSSWCWSSAA
jgi:membrane protein required for colicin V production